MTSRSPNSKDTSSLTAPKRRHNGGSRKPSSDRVTLRKDDQVYFGWALNISRGGIRIVLEDSIEPHTEYTFVLGDDDAHPREIRVAWIRDESGGQIAGLQFLDTEGTIPPEDMPD